MKNEKFPYDQFESFIKAFIINGENFLFEDNQNMSITTEVIDDILNALKDKSADELPESINNLPKEKKVVLLHAYWLWYYPYGFNDKAKDMLKKLFGETLYEKIKVDYINNEQKLAGSGGFGMQLHNEVLWILGNVFTLKAASYDEFKNSFINGFKNNTGKISSRNLILHLCNPEIYEPIAKNEDKEKIVNAFSAFKNQKDGVDDALKEIRTKLNMGDTSFYSPMYSEFWKSDLSSPTKKLEYKKALILYGPPGTSKTYKAVEMAKLMVLKGYLKNEKAREANSEWNEYFTGIKDLESIMENDDHISYLQLHINYNYEDFIAGQIIETDNNGKTIVNTKPGFIYEVIEKANADNGMPYVVILDEINRTDISRVFGELFTAIERRGKDIKLALPSPKNSNPKKNKSTEQTRPVSDNCTTGCTGTNQSNQENTSANQRMILNVPDNVYFIGTMNEIDFSLERVDFALRRRFVWEYCGYNSNTLKTIIIHRLKNPDEKSVSSFIDSCNKLNTIIKDNPFLGEAYQIGHAFFAEIANIFNRLEEDVEGINRWKEARKILWEISIKPTLEAYCGTMQREEKKKLLGETKNDGDFYKAFFN